MALLEDEEPTLEELCIVDDDAVLLEVRNKDLTWPEEMGALQQQQQDRRRQSMHKTSLTCISSILLTLCI